MKQISIYQVEEAPVGSGGMGRVLRGTDPQGRQIAIKEILPEFASDFEIRTRTEREVEMLQQLNNDSIVKVYDQFPLGDNFYIVMEFVDGRNVEQYVQTFGAIPHERATRFMIKILEAMQFVHEKNFVHRDMKPSNIMIRNDERICILDFGIAKDLGNKGSGTVVGTIIGSDGYMSPEQADGFDIDHRADIYALGCVFFYMLTGHHAYNTLASDFETRSNIANTPFPKLSKYSKKSFPPKLQEILDHATDKNMMRRYQSCREFRKDLESLISNTSITPKEKQDIFITVGREGCDILVVDNLMKVSRSHLDITYRQFTGGRYYVITDHSANGTLVNGRRLSRGESENIPADGAVPEVFLACDVNYPLDWEEVKRLIAGKLKEVSKEDENPTGGTQFKKIPVVEESSKHKTDVSFTDAIKLFFKRAFDFSGRSRRKEYWYFVLFNFLFGATLGLLSLLISFSVSTSDIGAAILVLGAVNVIIWIYMLVIAIPSLALNVRRLHDIGKNGWWVLIGLIPFIGGIILLVWMATDSEPGENDWGPCPK